MSPLDVTIEYEESSSLSESSKSGALRLMDGPQRTWLAGSTNFSTLRLPVDAVTIYRSIFLVGPKFRRCDPCHLVGNMTNLKSSKRSGTALRAPIVSDMNDVSAAFLPNISLDDDDNVEKLVILYPFPCEVVFGVYTLVK